MGPKQKTSVSPSEFGWLFVTPKLPWCFFTSYRSSMYWCHCGGLPLPLASPWYLWCFHHFLSEGICWDWRRFWWTLARVWCNPNKPMIVLLGGELLDIFDLFIPKLGEMIRRDLRRCFNQVSSCFPLGDRQLALTDPDFLTMNSQKRHLFE